jgi:exodeoxyribonuclease-5
MKHVVDNYEGLVEVCAPSGKAAHVLRSKGVDADTIHSAIYNFRGKTKVRNDAGVLQKVKLSFEPKLDKNPPSLFIVDEASMVNEYLARDIRALGMPILWVGDHGQLPPVGPDPRIMSNLDARLETIHRQALDNPIIGFAHCLRQGKTPRSLAAAADGDKLHLGRMASAARVFDYSAANEIDQVIVAFHRTRLAINAAFRKGLGYDGAALADGEKVIVTLNNRGKRVYNGMLGTVQNPTPVEDCPFNLPGERIIHWRGDVTLDGDGRVLDGFDLYLPDADGQPVDTACAGNQLALDYGYAITCHKAQGSEWDRVLVCHQECKHWDNARWGYTAATRAAKHLTVLA